MDFIYFFRIKNKLKSHKKVYKNNFFGGNISEFNQYMKLDKKSYIIYAELQLLIIKIDECESNLQKLSTRKLGENISSGYSMSTI